MSQADIRTVCLAANQIRDRLHTASQIRLRRFADRYRDINHALLSLSHANVLLHKACRLGYRGAAQRLTIRVSRFTDHLRRELDGLPSRLDPNSKVPTLRQLTAELSQIEDDFGGWDYRPAQKLLYVRTDPIRLEGVDLGPFSIELKVNQLSRLGDQRGITGHHPFQVIALEPNPAAGNRHITHPHVSDDRLCTGESTNAVKSALLEGRLADFYLIVRSLLQTYNDDSPYVSLDAWNGTECHECSERVREDDRYYCEECQHEVCNGCMSSCTACGDSSCYGCLFNCKHCEDYHCHSCMKQCSECDQTCCIDCLEEGLCPPCMGYKENQDGPEDSEEQNEAQPKDQEQSPEATLVEATATA